MPRRSAKDKVIDELKLRVEILEKKLKAKIDKINRLSERLQPFLKQEAEERQLLTDENKRLERLKAAEEAQMLLKESQLKNINRDIRRIVRKIDQTPSHKFKILENLNEELKEKHKQIDELCK
jgi:hypothetical protein